MRGRRCSLPLRPGAAALYALAMHPSAAALLHFFAYAHLPGDLAAVSIPFANLADSVATTLEGPEATVCLRKLLEAKDCAVRAKVAAMSAAVTGA